MPFYLAQVSLSRDVVHGYVAQPSDRTAVLAGMVESVGGTLHHLYYSLGDYDAVLIIEAPNNSVSAAISLAAADAGAISDIKTTALLTVDEAVVAMQAASKAKAAYKLPGS